MLSNTLLLTVGTNKADRHPFNERFVAMIEQVLDAEQAQIQGDIASKEAAFAELSPAKATREQALEAAKADVAAKNEALDGANKEVAAVGAAFKDANAELKKAKKAQKSGDEEIVGLTLKKQQLVDVQSGNLEPIVGGTVADDEKDASVAMVLKTGGNFGFDASLLDTAASVLAKPAADRGTFDATCLDQLQGAFKSAIDGLDEELSKLAPGKAERQAAVDQAEKVRAEAEASQTDLKAKAAAAKEAKQAADAARKAAAKSLDDFMPDLKTTGDAMDGAKKSLTSFLEGPKAAFTELKDLEEGMFKPKSAYYETVEGMKCDRAVIDACRDATVGQGDGRVSVEDAHKVFATVADGNKVTKVERWTLRYCMTEFKWTEAAHDWIVEALSKVPQEGKSKKRAGGKSYYEVIDGCKCDRSIIDTCRECVQGQGDGRVSVEDAKKVWEKAMDGKGVTDTEKWTLRYSLCAFNWTQAGHDFMIDQIKGL
jgi:hypothetical protein